jgi:hypothetical protein
MEPILIGLIIGLPLSYALLVGRINMKAVRRRINPIKTANPIRTI